MTERYLILEPTSLVATDLAETLAQVAPGSVVLLAATEDEATRALARVPALTAAFTHAEPAAFAATPLGQVLAARQVPVAYLSPISGAVPDAPFVLPSPFTESGVQYLLSQLAARRSDRPETA